jgi:ABC-type polar amino acid transport system ATPase subunit
MTDHQLAICFNFNVSDYVLKTNFNEITLVLDPTLKTNSIPHVIMTTTTSMMTMLIMVKVCRYMHFYWPCSNHVIHELKCADGISLL